jgi:predicted CXXCH cytochrome family protein
VGSGKRGRTYLFEQDGYWFEIPINWYAKKRVWDMAPNYLAASEMPLTMPVDPGCLRCHSSGAQPSLPEARNKYAGEPFQDGGITCTACHGDASAHLLSGGKTTMMKIDALAPVKRDSVCLSCHLEGQQAVVHQGKRLVDFQPGENLFDYASYYVHEAGSGKRATSQWEALLESGCKRGAGDRLTCTSCHDPHGSTAAMSAETRVAFYRGKCLQCHDADAARQAGLGFEGEADFASKHHPENQDCASCHMPRARSDDIAHEQVTDHRIPRVAPMPGTKAEGAAAFSPLVAIGTRVGEPGASTDRDLGLAYAFAASRGDREAGERAMQLLQQAEALPSAKSDAELHEQLGFLHQMAGQKDAAAREYQLALDADAHDSVAAGNLAFLKVGDRQYAAAVQLWDRSFTEDPVQLKAGMNLAIVECGMGRKEAALGTLDRILAFSPDDGQARELARGIRSGQHPCGVH